MNFQDIIKPLCLTPAPETNESPFDKGCARIATTVSRLSTFIQIPPNITTDSGYKRRLMFQYNFTFNTSFYIINAKQLMNHGAQLLYHGCLCVKWRAGNKLVNGVSVPNVLRYRLLDYRTDLNWSSFPLYVNQLVKKNFCIEFWMDETNDPVGITQDILLQTGKITLPSGVDDSDIVIPIDTDVLGLDLLCQPIPLIFPIDWSNQAYLDNI